MLLFRHSPYGLILLGGPSAVLLLLAGAHKHGVFDPNQAPLGKSDLNTAVSVVTLNTH